MFDSVAKEFKNYRDEIDNGFQYQYGFAPR